MVRPMASPVSKAVWVTLVITGEMRTSKASFSGSSWSTGVVLFFWQAVTASKAIAPINRIFFISF